MSQKEAIDQWLRGAEKSLRAAKLLHGDDNDELALFHCHLCTEKILKAMYIFESDAAAPKTHDLFALVNALRDPTLKENLHEFKSMSKFAIAARYDDPDILEEEMQPKRVEHWITFSAFLLHHAKNRTS